jgi:hypothetical protein
LRIGPGEKNHRADFLGLLSAKTARIKPPLRKAQRLAKHPRTEEIRDYLDGAIAQLGERLHGMQEVSGSIPLSSTKSFFHKIAGRPTSLKYTN